MEQQLDLVEDLLCSINAAMRTIASMDVNKSPENILQFIEAPDVAGKAFQQLAAAYMDCEGEEEDEH